MEKNTQTQRIISVLNEELSIRNWMEGFLLDCRARNLSKGTISFYKKKLKIFLQFCDNRFIPELEQITSQFIREYIIWLENEGHNAGGCHAYYRALKAFMKWYERETESDNWRNPIDRVRGPKVNLGPLEPAKIGDIKKMLEVCGNDFFGLRDKLILLVLMDTGARASELINLNIEDINPVTGVLAIRNGKGGKFRNTYLGRKSRKALRKYLKLLKDNNGPLFLNRYSERIAYDGLRGIMERLANRAGVEKPSIHSFRRYFALEMLRNGVDVFSLQILMGHSDIQILRRYLKQTSQDTLKAHIKGSPVDNWRL